MYPDGFLLEFPKSLNQLLNGEYGPLYNVLEASVNMKKMTIPKISPTFVKDIFIELKCFIKIK